MLKQIRKVQQLLLAFIMLLTVLTVTAGAVEYNTTIYRDEWYTTTLQGMAARKLYYCGIINGAEAQPQKLTDEMFLLDRPLTNKAAKIMANRMGQETTETDGQSSDPLTETAFLAMFNIKDHDASSCSETFSRGHAFELLADIVDATKYDVGRTLITPPGYIVLYPQTTESAMKQIDRAMAYGPGTIQVYAEKEVLSGVQKKYDENVAAYMDANFDTMRLNDQYWAYQFAIPSAHRTNEYLYINCSLADHVFLHLEREGWMFCFQDRNYVNAYKDFIKSNITSLNKEKYDASELIRKVSNAICQKATYAYNQDVTMADLHDLTGFLFNGRTVCDGYAQVFRACMYELDIPCVIVLNEDWTHAWNKVQLEDRRWLNVDVCWADTGYGSRTILVSDDTIARLGGHDNSSYRGKAYSDFAFEKPECNNT